MDMLAVIFSALVLQTPVEGIPDPPLQGGCSNSLGKIGVSVDVFRKRVDKIYEHSPANANGLQLGDIILSSNGKKGDADLVGVAGEYVSIFIKRRDETIHFNFPRAALGQIWTDLPNGRRVYED